MDVIQCLLDVGNQTVVDGTPLGERIRDAGKRSLWEGREEAVIDTVVIHFISAADTKSSDPYDLEAILKIFVDFGVSSHYLIDRAGVVRQLVPEDKKAWHCGGSCMPPPDSRQGVNEFSIGIELVATDQSGFTEEQYEACAFLCRDIEKRRGSVTYVGHQDIAGEQAVALGLRQDKKPDPGPLFDWQKLHTRREGADV